MASDGFFLGSNHRGLNQPESGSKPQIYGDFSIKIRMNIRLPAMTWAPLAANLTRSHVSPHCFDDFEVDAISGHHHCVKPPCGSGKQI